MKPGFQVFLAVAKHLSFTAAAGELNVTPQCVSDHIKRLEEEYDVLLFERRPHFKLTTAGAIMLNNLQNINIMEDYMARELENVSQGQRGSFTLGISTARAPIILPHVLPQYYHEFPDVNISFSEEDTAQLEMKLINGDIDLFIGVNTTPHPKLQIHTIATEGIYLIISARLLHLHFSAEEIESMKQGVDLDKFISIPFTLAFEGGKVNHVIQEYFTERKLRLNVQYNISDSETQIMICATGISAALCPRMLTSTAYIHNLSCNQQNYLYMFPINGMDQKIRIDLVSRNGVTYPRFIQRFIEITKAVTTASFSNFD